MPSQFKISSIALVIVISCAALAPRGTPQPPAGQPQPAPKGRAPVTKGKPELVGVKKISDEAKHSAFTDLAFYKDRWFCTFREGTDHVSPDGSICILESTDAEKWERAAHLTSADGDFRDPKLNITRAGRLMLSAAIALPKAGGAKEHRNYVWFSEDGRKWSDPIQVGDVNVWLWRILWHGPKAYGVGYGTVKPFVRLYQSEEGTDFTPIVKSLFEDGEPNEAGLAFLDDETMLCLLRRDKKGSATAQLGSARPPYTQWIWQDLGMKVGGPALLRLPDGRIVAACRLYEPTIHTALCWLDPIAGTLTPFQDLPSSGDTGYPGLVFRGNLLRVSYYSSHEGKTSIYLATVKF
jgi:hypothetical protein